MPGGADAAAEAAGPPALPAARTTPTSAVTMSKPDPAAAVAGERGKLVYFMEWWLELLPAHGFHRLQERRANRRIEPGAYTDDQRDHGGDEDRQAGDHRCR
jgi:hypothetical protein